MANNAISIMEFMNKVKIYPIIKIKRFINSSVPHANLLPHLWTALLAVEEISIK